MLRVYGILSHFEGKKIIIGGHHDSLDKLNAANKKMGGNGPILDGNKFYCYSTNPTRYEHLVGEKVTALVSIKRYQFESTYTHNKGAIVKGWSLYARDIARTSF
jgi:hypothetical protein